MVLFYEFPAQLTTLQMPTKAFQPVVATLRPLGQAGLHYEIIRKTKQKRIKQKQLNKQLQVFFFLMLFFQIQEVCKLYFSFITQKKEAKLAVAFMCVKTAKEPRTG